MSIEKLRQSLERAFGDVSVEQWNDGRFVAEADGHIKAGDGKVAPLVAFGETEHQALATLTAMVQDHAVKKRKDAYPRQIACPSRVFADDGHCVVYRNNQLIAKAPN